MRATFDFVKLQKQTNPKSLKARKSQWPKIYTRRHRSGQVGYLVDRGLINGKRERKSFKTKAEPETFAAQSKVLKQNIGMAGFALSHTAMVDAAQSIAILKPAGVSLQDASKYYRKHVMDFRQRLNCPNS